MNRLSRCGSESEILDTIQSLVSDWVSSGEGAILIVAISLAVVWQASGLVLSRNWTLLPLGLGLAGLSAFLLNPWADSTSAVDLRQWVLNRDHLLLLCGAQFLMAMASFAIALKLAGETERSLGRWQTLLAVLHCVPSPVVLVGALFAEQSWLSRQVGARPELVGINAGLAAAAVLAIACLLLAFVKQKMQTQVALTFACLVALFAGLLTTINQSLPEIAQVDATQRAIHSMGLGMIVVVPAVVIGFAWERYRYRFGRNVKKIHV